MEEKLKKQVVETFRNGYNCAQSVFSTFSEGLSLDKDTAMKMSSPFGSGIAYMQETCGAVTGALMCIGLKYGKGEHGTAEDKTIAYDMSKIFIEKFKKEHGSVCCLKLMNNLNMSIPEDMAEIQKQELFRVNCVRYIKTAVEITNKILTTGQN
jgi:C_GCAxxG_C_C family probable redox protein